MAGGSVVLSLVSGLLDDKTGTLPLSYHCRPVQCGTSPCGALTLPYLARLFIHTSAFLSVPNTVQNFSFNILNITIKDIHS